MLFPEFEEEEDSRFISANQVEEFLKDETHVFDMFASLKVETRVVIVDLLVVCEFSDVFPNDISDLSPEREVEFVVDLITGARLVSMAPYRMSASELGELKSELEELLEKKFIRSSVSSLGSTSVVGEEERW